MKKNLLSLLLVALISVFSNQVCAYTVTADIQLGDMPYHNFEGYYVLVVNSNKEIFKNGSNVEEVSGGEIRVMIVKDVIKAAGKSVDDLIVTWEGDAIPYDEVGTRYRFAFTVNTSGKLVIKYAEEDPGAIEGVDADDKTIYYADGVVYNQAGEIAIYDVNGKLITTTGEATVDVCDLASGVYIVRAADKVVKFVK